MKYFLKAVGATDSNIGQDFIKRLEDRSVGEPFWEDKCVSWLAQGFPTDEISKGDIVILCVVKGEKRKSGFYGQQDFGGRFLGYYEIENGKIYSGNLENRWLQYIELKNLCKAFGEKSKTSDL